MAPTAVKRRNIEDEVRRPKKKIKKFKKQKEYHSSSEDEEELEITTAANGTVAKAAIVKESEPRHVSKSESSDKETRPSTRSEVTDDQDESFNESNDEEELDEVEINTALNMASHEDSAESEEEGEEEGMDGSVQDESEEEETANISRLNELGSSDDNDDDDDDDELVDEFDSDDSTNAGNTKKKRNDPTAFATSISKILTTKLTTSKRADPILSRSKTADEANKALADGKLETKARASIRAEKRSLLEKGRVRDVLGLEQPGVDTGAIMEEEKRLKKTAQRGVVKLFNAVRAAQVKAEEAEKAAKAEGMVGIQKREERINEMSKEGFLELISRGGKAPVEA